MIHPIHPSTDLFLKGEQVSGKNICPSKRVNVFTLEGKSPFTKGESFSH